MIPPAMAWDRIGKPKVLRNAASLQPANYSLYVGTHLRPLSTFSYIATVVKSPRICCRICTLYLNWFTQPQCYTWENCRFMPELAYLCPCPLLSWQASVPAALPSTPHRRSSLSPLQAPLAQARPSSCRPERRLAPLGQLF